MSELQILKGIQIQRGRRLIDGYFPDTGNLRLELYPRHLEFFSAGAHYRERLLLAANRIGKTVCGTYETTCHLTGIYPAWWRGKRFRDHGIWWAAGTTGKKTQEILQQGFLGPVSAKGTGMIPANLIVHTIKKPGVPDAIEIIYVRHVSGKNSVLTLKSYEQGREAFEGVAVDGILLDEEPPQDVVTECLLRTMTTNGIVLLTFTPLSGLTPLIQSFLPGPDRPATRFSVSATWDDVPHLSEQVKRELWNSIPPYQRDARAKGIPQLGSGAIYPLPESEIVTPDIVIPAHWPRAYGLDVGWNRTAAIWGAKDRDTGRVVLYHEHYRSQAEPSVQVHGIQAPGKWIPGVVDPAARGRSQADGRSLMQSYRDLGLDLKTADNTVTGPESGIFDVWQMLSAGLLKVFASCTNWLTEFRMYRRDEKGRIVKEQDHLMDATRYLVKSGIERMKTQPRPPDEVHGEDLAAEFPYRGGRGSSGRAWMN